MTYFLGRIAGPAVLGLLRFVAWLIGDGPLRGTYVRLVCRLVRRTRLFDEEWYRLTNPDDIGAGIDPVRHFVLYGDHEGRWPMRLFDPEHYRAHAPSACPQLMNSLLHYAWLGRYHGATTSTWFDSGWYLNINRDVKFSRMDPLRHFVRFGWAEGRQPTEHFDRQQFLRAMSLRGGITDSPFGKAVDPDPPGADEWNRLQPVHHAGPVAVNVTIPVFRGRTETLRCIHAVLSLPQQTAFEVVVINDACPDAGINEILRQLAERGLIRYYTNSRSLGFVGTVNRGMGLSRGRDIVLLGADVEPCGDWLDRLRACAYRKERIASVTPLANNATICSYPRFNQDNPQFLELHTRDIDALAAKVNANVSVAAPTGGGFCMYVRRAAIDAVGTFDEKVFEGDFGAEIDFCQRAVAAGWQNLIAADVYVWRWDAGSRNYVGRRRFLRAGSILREHLPGYQKRIAAFVAADPLSGARQALDMARVESMIRGKNVLIVTHQRGGGTERHVNASCAVLAGEGYGVFVLRALKDGFARLEVPGAGVLPNLPAQDCSSQEVLVALCRRLQVNSIHIHQLVDFPREAISTFAALPGLLPGLSLELHVHDYFAICPRINLVDAGRVYCGEPDASQCNICLRRPQPSAIRVDDISAWRSDMQFLHETAAVVVVPDADVVSRLQRYFPAARFEVRPLEATMPAPVRRRGCIPPATPLHIVVIGAIVNAKGYPVLHACAQDARNRRLPLKFTLMGYSHDDRALRQAGVRVTGRYDEDAATGVLASLNADLAWLPSVWPETYSYTLSIALAGEMFVAAFDLGAIANRLREGGHDALLMPLAWHARPELINAAFLKLRDTPMDEADRRIP